MSSRQQKASAPHCSTGDPQPQLQRRGGALRRGGQRAQHAALSLPGCLHRRHKERGAEGRAQLVAATPRRVVGS